MHRTKPPKRFTRIVKKLKRTKQPESHFKRTKPAKRLKRVTKTQKTPVQIKFLNHGDYFVCPGIDMHGKLLYVNDCRARVQLTKPLYSFKNKTAEHVSFGKYQYLDISPSTEVVKTHSGGFFD